MVVRYFCYDPKYLSRAVIIIIKGGVLSCPVIRFIPSHRISFPFTSPIRDRRRRRRCCPAGNRNQDKHTHTSRAKKQKSILDVAHHLLYFYMNYFDKTEEKIPRSERERKKERDIR